MPCGLGIHSRQNTAAYLDCRCSSCTWRFSLCSVCSSSDRCSFRAWLWASSNFSEQDRERDTQLGQRLPDSATSPILSGLCPIQLLFLRPCPRTTSMTFHPTSLQIYPRCINLTSTHPTTWPHSLSPISNPASHQMSILPCPLTYQASIRIPIIHQPPVDPAHSSIPVSICLPSPLHIYLT